MSSVSITFFRVSNVYGNVGRFLSRSDISKQDIQVARIDKEDKEGK